MYILKNALRNISRSKGRNILIGLIIFVIALCACISLSIIHTAKQSEQEGLAKLNVTANISVDREKLMNSSSSKSQMKEKFSGMGNLSLSEYKKYSKADSVSDFTYSLTSSVNGAGSLDAVETSSTSNNSLGTGGFGKDNKSSNMNSGDFSLIGYSKEKAMSDFSDGTSAISSGSMLNFDSSNMTCIINSDLAKLNSLKVGNKIKVENPNDDSEIYTLKVVGIYKTSSTNDDMGRGGFMASSDPANQIYTNYETLKTITTKSSKKSSSNKITSMLNATYYFSSVENYEKFEGEATKLGLSDDYTVSSRDVTSFEESIKPLKSLSTFAKVLLGIVLIIGVSVLVILNIFNIRERKYEVGVLTAIGMKKSKIAMQFISEIFIITIVAVMFGTLIGVVSSPSVSNKLLSVTNNVTSSSSNNGRPEGLPSGNNSNSSSSSGNDNQGSSSNKPSSFMSKANNFVTDINASTDIKVVLELFLMCIGITVISSLGSVLFILRYEPLKILSERN